jgi:tRNA threonylcarbamoyladenosine biosynthesis protein TsaE
MLINNLIELKDFCKKLPIKQDTILLLTGELGTGKTTLAANILKKLLESEGPFTSPTFNLIHSYENAKTGWKIYHLDLYRLKNVAELEELGFTDLLLEEALIIIEWPDIAKNLLDLVDSKRIIRLKLSLVEGDKRIIEKDL